MEAAGELVVDAARGHAIERDLRHAQRLVAAELAVHA